MSAGDGTGEPIEIRPLGPADLAAAADLLTEAGIAWPAGLPGRLADALAAGGGRCLAAERSGRLVGVLLASYNGFHVFLSHLAVAPAERRRGVGARLHEELVRLAARDGARGVIADAQLSAVGFFERVGYRTPGAVFLIRDVESRRPAP